MTTDIRMLAWSVLLGIAYVLIASTLGTRQRGLKWNASNRDGVPAPLTGIAARASRASLNFLETYVFFVAAVLAVCLTNRNTPHTALGAELYFWARVVYLPVYLVGIPYLRTIVWAVSIWGLLQVLEAVL